MCNEFSNSYCDDKEGNARVSSLLFVVCVCFKTFCCSSTVMSKCAPKPMTKTVEVRRRINLLQKKNFAKGRKFSREKEKKRENRRKRVANHTKNARVYVTTGGEKSDDDE